MESNRNRIRSESPTFSLSSFLFFSSVHRIIIRIIFNDDDEVMMILSFHLFFNFDFFLENGQQNNMFMKE